METKVTTETTTKVNVSIESETPQAIDDKVTPKGKGKLDMVIAFDTTGSMAENDIIKFVKESKDTSGGDGNEFYELVLKKIIDESPWREDSSKAILLIADADPHEVGYTYRDDVVGNQAVPGTKSCRR